MKTSIISKDNKKQLLQKQLADIFRRISAVTDFHFASSSNRLQQTV